MRFLVLVLLWLVERNTRWRGCVQRDGAFLRLLRRVERAPRLCGRPLRQLLMLGLPLLAFALLLAALAPLAYGWLLLPLHLLALLWSLGRGDPYRALAPFRASWARGDIEAAWLCARHDLGVALEEDAPLLGQAQAFLLWQAHQGFFAPVFWFVLLGPLPALAYRALALLAEQGGDAALRARAVGLRQALDWLPARLLALSLALAGNFVAAYRALRTFVPQSKAEVLVVEVGRAAAEIPAEGSGVASLDELWRLLRRAGLIWYAAVALWVLLPL